MFEVFYWAIFPYIAITTLVIGSFYRYYNDRYSISSQSSQFLGNKRSLIFGSYVWHWAITIILTIHALGWFFISWYRWLITDQPTNVINIYEWTGIVLSSSAIVGMSVLIYRRIMNERLRVVTTWIDWLTFLLLYIQIWLGWWIAWDSFVINKVPGSTWFEAIILPWVYSVYYFNPVIGGMVSLNFWQQWHFVNAMMLFTIFPFSRLAHMLSYPYHYAYRSFQIIIWDNKVVRRARVMVRRNA